MLKSNLIKEEILSCIKAADVPPMDENIEEQKQELISLFNAVRIQYHPVKNLKILPPVENDQHWFVVGDIHGDYQSLRRIILKIFCNPSIFPDKVRIIFLGDYIDRGRRPVQVLRLLLMLASKFSTQFFLLKGNHELLSRDESGKIIAGCYPADFLDLWFPYLGEEVFSGLCDLFSSLPAAYLHDGEKRILYVHAGIPRTEDIKKNLDSDECAAGFLWSDPEDKHTVLNGPKRRFSFGLGDFHDFIYYHRIYAMVRSHEAKKDGADLHSPFGKTQSLITVYSTGFENNPDTGYPGIEQPRFLYLTISRKNIFAIEEIYREDIWIYLWYNSIQEREKSKKIADRLTEIIRKGASNIDCRFVFLFTAMTTKINPQGDLGLVMDQYSLDPTDLYDAHQLDLHITISNGEKIFLLIKKKPENDLLLLKEINEESMEEDLNCIYAGILEKHPVLRGV